MQTGGLTCCTKRRKAKIEHLAADLQCSKVSIKQQTAEHVTFFFVQQIEPCTPIDPEIQELEDLLDCPSTFRNSALYSGNLDLHGTL